MNDLQIFKSEEFGEVRTMIKDGEPWFVGKDVAEALGFGNPRQALISNVADEDKGVHNLDTLGGKQEVTVINESGVYGMIFNSRIESAKRFKHWVTSEVLPSIRKHGMYATKELIDNPDLLIEMATAIKHDRERIKLLSRENQILKPKAEFFDAVADSKSAVAIGDVARVLGIRGVGRNNLFDILRSKKVLMPNNQPYQRFIDSGYFRVIEQKYTKPDGETVISFKTLVYQKGVDYIRRLIVA